MKLRRVSVASAIALMFASVGRSQIGVTPAPAFDVTSVKPSRSANYWVTVRPMQNRHFSATKITVKQLLPQR